MRKKALSTVVLGLIDMELHLGHKSPLVYETKTHSDTETCPFVREHDYQATKFAQNASLDVLMDDQAICNHFSGSRATIKLYCRFPLIFGLLCKMNRNPIPIINAPCLVIDAPFGPVNRASISGWKSLSALNIRTKSE